MRVWIPIVAGAFLVGLSAVPAAAATAVDYVALGDSYAAGTGSSASGDDCGRRSTGYPARWAATHTIASYANLACAAHETGDVITEQVPALGAGTDLVTTTVGGNDIPRYASGYLPTLTGITG